jgi:hypothetical protein
MLIRPILRVRFYNLKGKKKLDVSLDRARASLESKSGAAEFETHIGALGEIP